MSKESVNNKDISEYDNQIWTVFSVGVISSIVILYYFYEGNLNESLRLPAVIFGFIILEYSFFTILGYSRKKEIAIKLLSKYDDFTSRLREENYCRTRWMGETIIGLLILFYLISFYNYYQFVGICIFLSISIFLMILIFLADRFKK